MSGISDPPLQELSACFADRRITNDLLVASAALFFYDFCLTFSDELRCMWRPKGKFTVGSALFFTARYTGFASTILSLFPRSLLMDSTCICLRVITVLASELILAVRTWAIWSKKRNITVFLILVTVLGLTPVLVIVSKDIVTHHQTSGQFQDISQCWLVTSDITVAWVVPYLVVILYESLLLSLSFIMITRWRKKGSGFTESHLLDTLWNDGLMYFLFTLGLGIVNIGLVLQVSSPRSREGGTQLQTCFHSMLSTRTILHLARSRSGPKSISEASSSLRFTSFESIESIIPSEEEMVDD